MIQYEEDNNSQEIAISNVADWMKFNTPREQTSTDLFKVSGEDLTKISGLSPAFRRKMSRELQKRFQGIEGTETQQNLLAQAITGMLCSILLNHRTTWITFQRSTKFPHITMQQSMLRFQTLLVWVTTLLKQEKQMKRLIILQMRKH